MKKGSKVEDDVPEAAAAMADCMAARWGGFGGREGGGGRGRAAEEGLRLESASSVELRNTLSSPIS